MHIFFNTIIFLFCSFFNAYGMEDMSEATELAKVSIFTEVNKQPMPKIKSSNYRAFITNILNSERPANSEHKYKITSEIAIHLAYDIVSTKRLPHQIKVNHTWNKETLQNEKQIDFKPTPHEEVPRYKSSESARQDLAFKLYYLSQASDIRPDILNTFQVTADELVNNISLTLNSSGSQGAVAEKVQIFLRKIEGNKADLPWQIRYPRIGKIHYFLSTTSVTDYPGLLGKRLFALWTTLLSKFNKNK